MTIHHSKEVSKYQEYFLDYKFLREFTSYRPQNIFKLTNKEPKIISHEELGVKGEL